MTEIQNTDRIKHWQGRGAQEPLLIEVEMKNGIAFLDVNLAVPYQTKHTITKWSSS